MAIQFNNILSSPGVNVNITDQTTSSTVPAGTNVYIVGFSAQGPTNEPTYVSSLSEFESIFGLPTVPAERYFHDAVSQLLNTSPARVLVTRMPPGSGSGIGFADQYSALVFPVVGVSATPVTPCDFYRQVDETNLTVNFPWLTQYFTPTNICYGSDNLNCPLNHQDEVPGFLYIQDHPFQYNSVMTGFKFVVDSDTSPEDLKLFQLRPTVNGFNTFYSVVTSFSLSSIFATGDENQVYLSNDGQRLIVNIQNTSFAKTLTPSSGLLSGQTLSGIFVSAGDVFGTYSQAGAPVLSYYTADPSVAGSYKTSISSLSGFGTGSSFTVVTTAVQATTIDQLISFCGVPVDAGLSCATITSLGLTVPEQYAYNFQPLIGDAVLRDANFYVFGEPIAQMLNESQYQLLVNQQFNWKCGAVENNNATLDVLNNNVRAGMIVIDKLKSSQLDDFTGYYLAVNDNLNVNPNTDFNGITGVNAFYSQTCPGVSGDWVSVPDSKLNFELSASFDGFPGSISEKIEKGVQVDFGTPTYNDSLIMTLFKLSPAQLTNTVDVLNERQVEQFYGSLNADRKVNSLTGGPPRSLSIEKTVNDQSNYLTMMVNPYLSKNNCWNDTSGQPQKTVRMFNPATGNVFNNFSPADALTRYADNLYGIGSYGGTCQDAIFNLCQKKDIGNLPGKLQRALMEIENPQDWPLDLTLDAGLSTIWATRQAVIADHCITDPSICYNYDDTYYVDTTELDPFDGTNITSPLRDAWQTIFNIFDSFASTTRPAAGDVGNFHIEDPLRQIFVNGPNYKVVNRQKLVLDPVTGQPTTQYATFSRNIWSQLRNLYSGVDSSFSESHANWILNTDINSGSNYWYPSSPYKAALFARNDRSGFPWTAALGINPSGTLKNVLDLAINPNQRERDLITKLGINPICRFSDSGNVVWNTLTLQKQQSALSENYIRRGSLWLGKAMQSILRQFIGQPNNVITRTRVNNVLKPVLQFMKDNQGIYDYMIVCDSRNNTPESIDQYVLNVTVYTKFTRTTKYVLANIIITDTGLDFSTIVL